MAESLTFTGKVTGIEESVAAAWRRVEGKRYNLNMSGARGAIKGLTEDIGRFEKSLDSSTRRFTSFAAAGAVFLGIQRTFASFVRSTVEVEAALARINVNLDEGSSGLQKFSKDLFNVARQTGSTFESAAKSAEEFARQGLTVSETLKRTKDALILSRIAAIDQAEATQDLTAAVNTFQKEALTTTEIVNRLAAVDTRFAVSSRDLGLAISRVGNSAQEAGVSFNELLGIVTAVQQTTQRGGSVIGNSLKTIFTRIARPEVLDQMQQLGVATRDTNNQFLPAIQILKNLSGRYDELSQSQKSQLAESVGGVYQINILKAAVADLSKEYSTYSKVLDVANNAQDAATQKNEQLNRTLQASINATAVSIKELLASVGQDKGGGLLKTVLDQFQEARRYLSGDTGSSLGKSLGDGIIKGLSNVLTGPVAIGAIYALGATFRRVSSGILSAAKEELGIKTLAEKRAMVYERINQVLSKATLAEQQQIKLAGSLLAQKEAILAVSERIAAAEARSSNYRSALVSSFMEGGKVDPRLRRARRSAGGYIPAMSAEASDIARGIGGASPSARPVLIPNFPYGGGKSGPMVANTDEYIVPHFAGGGAAVFNPAMVRVYGLPSGAQKVTAAGGYVPNAADGLTGLRTTGGQFISRTLASEFNSLFETLRLAANRKDAGKVASQILGMTESLNQASRTGVYEKVTQEINKFNQGLNEMAMRSRIRRYVPRASGVDPNEIRVERGGNISELAMDYAGSSDYESPIGPSSRRFYYLQKEQQEKAFQSSQNRRALIAARLRAKKDLAQRRMSNAGLGLSFLAPFAAGFVPDEAGGSVGGIASGAASYALQGAGLGATLGSFIPGIGTVAGAGIGAGGGALAGAFSKITKSASDLAAEFDKQRDIEKTRLTQVGEFIQLQESYNDALASGNIEMARKVGGRRDMLLQSVSPETASMLRGSMSGGNGLSDLSQKLQEQFAKNELSRSASISLREATGGFLGNILGSSKNNMTAAAGNLASLAASRGINLSGANTDLNFLMGINSSGTGTNFQEFFDKLGVDVKVSGANFKDLSKILEEAKSIYEANSNSVNRSSKTLREFEKSAINTREALRRAAIGDSASQTSFQGRLDRRQIASGSSLEILRGFASTSQAIGLSGKADIQKILDESQVQTRALEQEMRDSLRSILKTSSFSNLSQEQRSRAFDAGTSIEELTGIAKAALPGNEELKRLQENYSDSLRKLTLTTEESIKTSKFKTEQEQKVAEAIRRQTSFSGYNREEGARVGAGLSIFDPRVGGRYRPRARQSLEDTALVELFNQATALGANTEALRPLASQAGARKNLRNSLESFEDILKGIPILSRFRFRGEDREPNEGFIRSANTVLSGSSDPRERAISKYISDNLSAQKQNVSDSLSASGRIASTLSGGAKGIGDIESSAQKQIDAAKILQESLSAFNQKQTDFSLNLNSKVEVVLQGVDKLYSKDEALNFNEQITSQIKTLFQEVYKLRGQPLPPSSKGTAVAP